MHYGRFHRFGSPHATPPGVKVRPIKVCGDLAYVPLTKGKFAVIDAADIDLVKDKNWSYVSGPQGNGYAKAAINRSGFLPLHRRIMTAPPGYVVDHINGDGLDNRRVNLRIATTAQNAMNKRGRVTGSSVYKGVTFDKKTGKWQAAIRFNGKEVYLGQFATDAEAHLAYSEAAAEKFGEFARFT